MIVKWWKFTSKEIYQSVEPLQRMLSHYEGFHTRVNKVQNLNDHLNCAILIIIQMTVFWTVCTQIYIAMRNLNCAVQITHRHVNLHVHTIQNTVIWMIIQIAHFSLVWKQSKCAGYQIEFLLSSRLQWTAGMTLWPLLGHPMLP